MSITPSKPFLTYQQQLHNLQYAKNMVIPDSSYALIKLQSYSYYALVDGYKNLFYDGKNRKYIENTTFESIVALYDFDAQLRILLFKYICQIEQHMRSLISYNFCEIHTANQAGYLNPSNYTNALKKQKDVQNLISLLFAEANIKTNHPYVVHQRNTYGNVPLWVLIKTLSFGQMSKMYSLLPSKLQTKISHSYPHVNEKELSQYLRILTDFRNICAHNERLFSHRCRYEVPDTLLHSKLKLPQTGNHYNCGKSDFFCNRNRLSISP